MLKKLLAIMLCALCFAGCGGGSKGGSKDGKEQKPVSDQEFAKEILQTPQPQQEASPKQEESLAPPPKARKDFGKRSDFWKGYKAELEGVGAPLAYGKGDEDHGAIGGLEKNDKRVQIDLDSALLSSAVSKITIRVRSGEVGQLSLLFLAGCEALVYYASPELSEEEAKKVLDDVHLTKNAKSGAATYTTKRGDVLYTFENKLEYMSGLEFSAEIKK